MANYHNFQKLTQALNYIANRYEGHRANRLRAIKLLWAADRYHVRRYGRLISTDDYCALPHGPVNGTALSIASERDIAEPYRTYARKYLGKDGYWMSSSKAVDKSKLSETDIEALEFAIKTFAPMGLFKLRDLSHKYPEWVKHSYVEQFQTSASMEPADFFLDPDPAEVPDDKFKMDSRLLADSKEIFEESQTLAKVLQ